MKSLTYLIIFLTPKIILAQNNIESQALKLFNKYAPKIEESNKLVIQYRKVIQGDLNNDSLIDAIVEFGLGEKGSNGVVIRQAAIYINIDGHLKVISAFEPDYCLAIDKIEDGIVTVEELEACLLPWPKTISLHYYKLMKNKLVEIDKSELKSTKLSRQLM